MSPVSSAFSLMWPRSSNSNELDRFRQRTCSENDGTDLVDPIVRIDFAGQNGLGLGFKGVPMTILVTGASSGIGLELARIFARHGSNLVLVARRVERLEEIARELADRFGVKCHVLALDLTQPDTPRLIREGLDREKIEVDILVNNAGFGCYGLFSELDLQTQLDVIQLNVVALTQLTHLLLPDLSQRGGRILNVASTAAFQPGPLMAVYFATKAFVLSISEALANELEGSGVSVTVLCPGPTKSDFQRRAGMEEAGLARIGLMDAQAVAYAGYQGLMQGRRLVIPGTMNKLAAFATRLIPRSWTTRVVRRLQERTHSS